MEKTKQVEADSQLWWSDTVSRLQQAYGLAGPMRADVFDCAIKAALVEESIAADREHHKEQETPDAGESFRTDFETVTRIAKKYFGQFR